MTLALPWLVALPALIPAGMTALNLVGWPRGRPTGRLRGRISALVPARDEESTIEACVRAILASEHPVHEVLVYDDQSADATPRILARLAAEDPRVQMIRGRPLPDGWVGKPHACHQLSLRARGDVLLFLDADTTLAPTGISRLAELFNRYGADAVSAMPHQRTGSFFERLMLPMLHLTVTGWLPTPLVWRSQDPRFLAANGQVFAVRRWAYDAVGGHQRVAGEVVEDMALGRALKGAGRRLVFADGHDIASCRMYDDARGVWEGFSKNLYEGLGERPALLALALGLILAAFVAPYLALAASPWLPALLLPALVGVALNLATRAACAIRFGHGWLSVLLHPFAALALVAIALNSARWVHTGRIRWRGRVYQARAARGTA